MAKRFLIIALMIIFIAPVYSKKDSFLKKCKCNETIMVGNENKVSFEQAIAKSCKKESASSLANEINFSAPIGQYLTSFE